MLCCWWWCCLCCCCWIRWCCCCWWRWWWWWPSIKIEKENQSKKVRYYSLVIQFIYICMYNLAKSWKRRRLEALNDIGKKLGCFWLWRRWRERGKRWERKRKGEYIYVGGGCGVNSRCESRIIQERKKYKQRKRLIFFCLGVKDKLKGYYISLKKLNKQTNELLYVIREKILSFFLSRFPLLYYYAWRKKWNEDEKRKRNRENIFLYNYVYHYC